MTQTDNLKIKPKKYINLAISISGKNHTIRVFKDVIKMLNCPKYICLKIKNNDAIAILPSDIKEPMSFRVPQDLFSNENEQFVITSKSFVSGILLNNNLNYGSTYRLLGYYSKKENALIFNMNNILPKNLVLKMQRQKLGITQQTVADGCNIYYSQYQKFESGDRDIMNASFGIAFRILTFLQINIDAFIDNKYGVDIANNLTIFNDN